jgi:hypothetical protein
VELPSPQSTKRYKIYEPGNLRLLSSFLHHTKLNKPINQLAISVSDQAAVSAGNFLTIALGANLLPLEEQGKLIYIYAIYIAMVLFNVSAFFSSANTVRNEIDSTGCYQRLLLKAQLISAALTSILLAGSLFVFHAAIKWQLTGNELIALLIFLLLQQIADFYRRSGYIFNHIKMSTLSSFWLYGIRISGLLYFRPNNLLEFLSVMIIPIVPIALFALEDYRRNRNITCDSAIKRNLIQMHLGLSKWSICNAPFKWAGLHSPILLVGVLHSIEAAAILGTIRALTTFANVLLELLETFIPAWLVSKAVHGNHVLRKSSLYLLGIGAVVWGLGFCVILIFGKAVIYYVLDSAYIAYSNILYILWMGSGIYFLSRTISLHYRTKKNTWLELMGSIIGAFTLLATLPLITLYGAWGGAWCLVIVQSAMLTSMLIYRTVRIRYAK